LTAPVPISENAHRGYQLLPAPLPRTRTLLTTRRRWRNRVSVRRRASGRAHYNYFRDYDPAIGRYAQSDPIGLADGPNTYSYSANNPSQNVDPAGLNTIALPPLTGVPTWAGPAGAVTLVAAGAVWTGSKVYDRYGTGMLDLICRDDGSECAKEWEEAFRICRRLLSSRIERGNWRTVGKRPPTLMSCAKGYVSERCGGNPVE
jgi:RHS repeat-associated protein